MAKLIEVIEVEVSRGNGKDIPFRGVTQYYTKDGVLLAERDPYAASIEVIIGGMTKGLMVNNEYLIHKMITQ